MARGKCGEDGTKTFTIWLLSCSIILVMIPVNIARIAVIWFAVVFFTARGIGSFAEWFGESRRIAALLVISGVYFGMFCFFAGVYFQLFSRNEVLSFEKNFAEAVGYASNKTTGTIYVTDSIIEPYIHILFA